MGIYIFCFKKTHTHKKNSTSKFDRTHLRLFVKIGLFVFQQQKVLFFKSELYSKNSTKLIKLFLPPHG